jgi:anti-anti-sigma factor
MVGGTMELERECGVWLVTLRGEHDLTTAPKLRHSLARSFSGGWTVIIDMSEADFIDSTTLNVLIRARRQRHPIALVTPSDTVADDLWLSSALPTRSRPTRPAPKRSMIWRRRGSSWAGAVDRGGSSRYRLDSLYRDPNPSVPHTRRTRTRRQMPSILPLVRDRDRGRVGKPNRAIGSFEMRP